MIVLRKSIPVLLLLGSSLVALSSCGDGGQSPNSQNGVAALAVATSSGSIDQNFGTNGLVRLPDTDQILRHYRSASGIVEQADGKVLIQMVYGGRHSSHDSRIFRINPDGGLDLTFGGLGYVDLPSSTGYTVPKTLLLKCPNGANRYHDWGAKCSVPEKLLIVAEDIDLVGETYVKDSKLFQLNHDVSLDQSFPGNGKIISPGNTYIIKSAKILSNGKLIFLGHNGSTTNIYRLNEGGSADLSYGNQGKSVGFQNVLGGMGIGADERPIVLVNEIEVVGESSVFKAIRLDEEGALDPSFGTNGQMTLPKVIGLEDYLQTLHTVLVQDNGAAIIGGDASIIKLKPNGKLDGTFGNGGISSLESVGLGDFDVGTMAFDYSGKLIFSVNWGTAPRDYEPELVFGNIVRLKKNGQLDLQFGTGGHSASLPCADECDRRSQNIIGLSSGKILAINAYNFGQDPVVVSINP